MGYYPDFTSPIENDIFGSNDSLIVRHFVDSLFTGSTGLRAGERAGSVAQRSGEANPSLFSGLPPRLDGHSLAQLTLRAHHRLVNSLLLLTVEGLPSHPPKHPPTPLLIKLLFTSQTS